jgi:amino acid permease
MASPALGYRLLDPPRPQGGLFATALNLSNNMMGAGLLTVPYCLMETSVVTGIIIFSVVAVVAGLSFMLLAQSCDLAQSYSYLEMGKQALGPNFGNLVLMFLLLYTTGVNITQIVLLGDFLVEDSGLLAHWAGESFLFQLSPLNRRLLVIGVIAVVFLFPLALLRSLNPLKFTSSLSLLCIAFTVVLIAYTLAAHPEQAGVDKNLINTVEWASFDFDLFAAIPIINVAFTAHYNSPRFYKELGNDPVKMRRVVAISVTFVLFIYLTTAICGYLLFGSQTCGDILTNFNQSYNLAICGRLALCCLIVCTFPFACFSIRNSFIALAFGGRYDMDSFPTNYHITLAVAVVATVSLIGCVATDVKYVLAYNGAIFGSVIVYVFPPMIYVGLLSKKRAIPLGGLADEEEPDVITVDDRTSLKVVVPFLWGLLAFFLGIAINALKQAHEIGAPDNPQCNA